jgi:hypothetical protein
MRTLSLNLYRSMCEWKSIRMLLLKYPETTSMTGAVWSMVDSGSHGSTRRINEHLGDRS